MTVSRQCFILLPCTLTELHEVDTLASWSMVSRFGAANLAMRAARYDISLAAADGALTCSKVRDGDERLSDITDYVTSPITYVTLTRAV